MNVQSAAGSSLQISTEVVSRIASLAAQEIEGVADVSTGRAQSVRGLLGRASLQKPVVVTIQDGIAEISICLSVSYGSKVMSVCEKVQENVKATVQNMTGITVSRVNTVVCGVSEPEATAE